MLTRHRDLIRYREREAYKRQWRDGIRGLEISERRRFEFARLEEGNHAAAFTDLFQMPSWFVVNWAKDSPQTCRKIGIKGCLENPFLLQFYRWYNDNTKGGEHPMAKSISVNQLLAEAQEAQEAYEAAAEQRKNIKKVVRTLADADLLEEEDVDKINAIFPQRKEKEEEGEGEE